MSTQTPTSTHQAVQDYYGKAAREAGSCCQPSAQPEELQNNLYPLELLSDFPMDIINASAGSGDPISLAKLNLGEIVLDLGSGAGLDCFIASKQIGENGHVIGVDMTSEMLALAMSNASRLKVQNVEFRKGYLEDLPVEDGSVDVIISNCVINLSPDKPQVFREMFRVLKPGGRIAISDMVSNHPLPDKATKNEKEWCNCTSGALSSKIYHSELGKAGFVDILIEPNIEVITRAFESGQVRSPKNLTKEQMLADLKDFEKIEHSMIIPNKITARKPA